MGDKELQIETIPPRIFLQGAWVRLSVTHAFILKELAKGPARKERLEHIAAGPRAESNVVTAQISQLRRVIAPKGLNIRAIYGWGFELVK